MDLATLVTVARGDRSYRQLADASDGTMSHQTWQQLGTKTHHEFLRPDTMRTVARVLRVSERQVVLACAESLGLDTVQPGDRLAAFLPTTVDDLADDQLAAVRMVIETMLRNSSDGGRRNGRP